MPERVPAPGVPSFAAGPAADGHGVVAAPQLRVRAGNMQVARTEHPFAAQLRAELVDGAGIPLAGVAVTFRVVSGPAHFARGARAATSTTDRSGVATSQVLQAGTSPGAVKITAGSAMGARPATFAERVIPGALGPLRR